MSGNFVGRRQTQKLWVELWVGVFKQLLSKSLKKLAGTTRLELATSAVTGQRSNQLNYVPSLFSSGLWETLDFAVLPSCQSFCLVQTSPPDNAEFKRAGTASRQQAKPLSRALSPLRLNEL